MGLNLVRVILDPAFGERLAALPVDEPVWIIESAINTPVALRIWKDRPNGNQHITGITTFTPVSDYEPEEELVANLDAIDRHHGAYSVDPPYSTLEVIGCVVSDRISAALAGFGLQIQSIRPDGFTAARWSSTGEVRMTA